MFMPGPDETTRMTNYLKDFSQNNCDIDMDSTVAAASVITFYSFSDLDDGDCQPALVKQN